ncbi:glycosyltransferase family 4 protein [Kamptonema formosum]|uniref:glycosyltransferase family 4 protein n=1 Tax=Kamptonema formosum TaxID=331992 RepID=UPI0003467D70|nr:glycosyltransferase family 1 protein [Oscillatoria sp. PCC 10802]
MVKPLRIGIIMSADKTWMGGVIYIHNLVKAIASLELPGLELYLIVPSDSAPEIYNEMQPFVKKLCVEKDLAGTFWNQVQWKILRKIPFLYAGALSKIAKREQLDFLYPVNETYGLCWDLPCAWATWIPDFQHKYLPEFFSERKIKLCDFYFNYMGHNAPAIIFSSQVALEDFKRFYPGGKAQTFVLNFRSVPYPEWFVSDPMAVQEQYKLPERFFLVSNQFWVHKNHKIIIEALALLKKEKIEPVIVCTGNLRDGRFPGYDRELLALIQKYELDEQVKLIGLIPRIEQIQLMRRALAVIQPSLFEGWSTVVEDARLLGKAIILSDIPVHLEQNPPHATFFRRDSPQDLAEKIKLLLPELIPGPDFSNEENARKVSQYQRQRYGEEFLEIVRRLNSVRHESKKK